jgi:S1-C subfamily serine protease
MNALEQLSDSLASAVQLAGEGIVRVEGRRRIPSSGIVWDTDGLIVTAHHTIDRRSEIRVGFPGGDTATAKLLGRDPATDLAVLRAPTKGGRALTQADAAKVKAGHLALAIGRPGDTIQATLGIISAVEAGWRSPLGGHVEQFLQSDVVMYPGFSGGPLIDAWGKVIGMNTSALVRGISLAIRWPRLANQPSPGGARANSARFLGVGAAGTTTSRWRARRPDDWPSGGARR